MTDYRVAAAISVEGGARRGLPSAAMMAKSQPIDRMRSRLSIAPGRDPFSAFGGRSGTAIDDPRIGRRVRYRRHVARRCANVSECCPDLN